MTTWKTALPLIGISCWMSGIAAADESVMLRPKFKQGDSIYIELDQQIARDQSGRGIPGGSMTIHTRRTYGFIQEVKAVSASKTYLNLTFDRVSQKFDAGPMADFYFDSDAPAHEDTDEQVAEAMSPMLGMTLQLEFDKDFHVTTASGMIPLREKVGKALGQNMLLRQILWQELDDARAKVMYGESRFALYPNKEVKVGDEWTRTFTDQHPQIGVALHTYHCKLDRISEEGGRKVAIITFEGTVANKPSAAGASDETDPMKVDGQSTGTGTFDIDQGLIVKTSLEGKTKLRTLDEEGKESKSGMNIDMEIKTTWTVMPVAEREKIKAENAKVTEAAQKAAAEKKAARKKAGEERRAKAKAEPKEDEADSDDESDDDADADE
ncbi:MAG TPA: DUF6263 family protein [Phycisphaerae bacterium]|nr:DUF6263 family protein [Phycisphaerae bacterium]